MEHIIGSCQLLANTEYTKRHNNVAKNLLQHLAGNIIKAPYFKYELLNVIDNQNMRLYWDREIRTDITVQANRPDILYLDKSRQKVRIIGIANPLTHNISTTYNTKISKYTDLADEMKKLWKVKKVIIQPIVISNYC